MLNIVSIPTTSTSPVSLFNNYYCLDDAPKIRIHHDTGVYTCNTCVALALNLYADHDRGYGISARGIYEYFKREWSIKNDPDYIPF